MRRLPPFLLLAACALAQTPCAIRGVVVDDRDGKPLAGVKVFLDESALRPELLQSTDTRGAFCFARVSPGSYHLTASKAGYLEQHYGTLLTSDGKSVLPALVLKLIPRTILSGVVMGADGEPAAGADVEIYRRVKGENGPNFDYVDSQQSDDHGAFRFADLAPGTYYLSARLSDSKEPRSSIAFLDEKGQPRHEATVETYYSGALSPEDAKPIAMRAGRDATGLVLTLRQLALRHISGRVPAGTQAPYLLIDGTAVQVDKDGAFYRADLQPRTYELTLRSNTKIIARKHVDVTAGDADGVTLDAVDIASFNVAISFRTEGGGPAYRPKTFWVILWDQADGIGAFAQPQEDGTYLFRSVIPGLYKLRINLDAKDLFVKRVLAGGEAVEDNTIDLRSGRPAPIEVVFSPNVATLEGRVTRDDPGYLATTVLLMDGPRIVTQTPTDQDSRFHMEGIKPGKYRLLAIEEFDESEWGAEEWKAALPKAVAVALAESEKKVVSVPVIAK
jgi:protocatechuate 3,4-dioxygenase beta subunit